MTKDLYVGQRINNLTIISLVSSGGKNKHKIYRCKCVCGNIKDYRSTLLKNNKRFSCGCHTRKNLVGKKFYRWMVIEYAGKNNINRNTWKCKCECGTIKNISADSLQSKTTKSCGCFKSEQTSKNKLKDLSGKKFGKLFVVERVSKIGTRHIKYKCLCDCGRLVNVIATNLTRFNSQTCSVCKKKNTKCSKRNTRNRREGTASWRLSVFRRDNFRCVVCGSRGYLNAHHLNGYHWFISGRNDVNNGVSLCACENGCHQKFHFKYGNKNNTKEQFMEFLGDEKFSRSII